MEYAQHDQDNYHQPGPQTPRPPAGLPGVLKLLPYLGAIIVAYMLVLNYGQENPQVVDNVIVRLDVLGITHLAAEEQRRINSINHLDLPYEKRQVLINKTIFIGADRGMTLLSLGQPRKVLPASSGKDGDETWVYHFFSDPRPTMLAFENGALVNAYKGSQADLAEISALTQIR